MSHQLTPFFMLGACAALVLVRRCTLPGLPILLGVIFAGYVSFATVGYWSGHLSNVFGGVGDLGLNVTTSVGSRLLGSTPTHLVALHAKEVFAALIVGLAVLGLARRRVRGRDDRVLLALFLVPIALVGVVSYGGEIALRTYLFLLPPASIFAALLFFPRTHSVRSARSARRDWRSFVRPRRVRRRPPGRLLLGPLRQRGVRAGAVGGAGRHQLDLCARRARREGAVAEHGPGGRRHPADALVLSGPRNGRLRPDPRPSVTRFTSSGLVSALRRGGPGSYLIATRTQISAMQQTASYAPDWESRFNASMSSAPGVRVAFSTGSAVVYTLNWPPGARFVPPVLDTTPGPRSFWMDPPGAGLVRRDHRLARGRRTRAHVATSGALGAR